LQDTKANSAGIELQLRDALRLVCFHVRPQVYSMRSAVIGHAQNIALDDLARNDRAMRIRLRPPLW